MIIKHRDFMGRKLAILLHGVNAIRGWSPTFSGALICQFPRAPVSESRCPVTVRE